MTRVGLLAAFAAVSAVLVLPKPQAATTVPPCDHSVVPYAGVAGASLTPTDHLSKDEPPVAYTLWRGYVPGFDGMPFSVDVTIPCGETAPLPTVTMAHGFGDDKTVWEETGKSDRVVSEGRPETNTRWNNIWFASRGYAVLNYTARGWNDSCGPDVPGAVPLVAPAPACLAYEYWIHLDDKRWEVRDIQWLTGGLVQSGIADATRLAVTGGSYGGAPTVMAALLGSRVMCGASAVPAGLGPDPCVGKADAELVPWTTPDGSTLLRWAAAVPLYTFGDLIQVLAPNGRGSDGEPGAPDGDHTNPFGVPIQSTVAGLLAAGQAAGYFAPPGVDPTSDIFVDTARLLSGNPFPQDDPLVARGIVVYRKYKSPITTIPVEPVPVFWVQGFTDPLFPATEALQVRNMARAAVPNYPMKLFFGDFGHDYTGQRLDEWELAREQMNAFIDHYLRPDRGAPVPAFDVGATVTRCLDHDAPMRFVAAPAWSGLHPHAITFEGTEAGTTSSAIVGPSGLATDPISTATLPLPGSYKGCRKTAVTTDPNSVTYVFPVTDDIVLMGGPVVEIVYGTTASDTELNVRLWDVAADESVQGLVTRGTYRSVEAPGEGLVARFQIQPQGYRFPAGHSIKVEVAANDAPYFQQSNVPALVTVEGLVLTLPLLERAVPPVAPSAPAPAPAPSAAPGGARHPATGGTPLASLGWTAAIAALVVRSSGASSACRRSRAPRC